MNDDELSETQRAERDYMEERERERQEMLERRSAEDWDVSRDPE